MKKLFVIVLFAQFLIACGSVPDRRQSVADSRDYSASFGKSGKTFNIKAGMKVVKLAQSMIGTPYEYGGSSPYEGFDCSGLVFYSYKKAGFSVPRTTSTLYRKSRRVKKQNLAPGDLVFFKLTNKVTSHVGIYAGNERFIHAPSSGKKVMISKISDPFWNSKFVGGGRFN